MAIRVLINGANGKMGKMAVAHLSNQRDFSLVGTTGRTDDLSAAILATRAQVVVDLTNAKVVLENTNKIIDAGAHPVVGTSGLTKTEVASLQERCKALGIGGLIVPNFSLGAVLLMKQAQELVKYFPQVEIIEMHHDGKLDSPSGTALRTAEMLAQARPVFTSKDSARVETVAHSRGALYDNIRIHAIRLPGLMAHLEVIFGGTGETISICHDTYDRQCYMPGLQLACKKAFELNELVYGLESII